MHRLIKIGIHGLLILGTAFSAGAQNVTELLSLANNAYEQGNYASARHFYLMVVDQDSRTERNSAYPYEMMAYTGSNGKYEHIVNASVKSQTVHSRMGKEERLNKNEQFAIHRIAECARLLNDYRKAEKWYVKSLQINWGAGNDFSRDRFWYATILVNNDKYGQAANELDRYLLEKKDTSQYYITRAKMLIKSIEHVLGSDNGTGVWKIWKSDPVLNQGESTFASAYFGSEKLFISSAKVLKSEDETGGGNKWSGSDIYVVTKNGTQWSQPESLPGDVNEEGHEGAVALRIEEKAMFFTRWPLAKNDASSIYLSKFFIDKWMQPKKLNDKVNVPGYSSMHPATTAGDIIFFSSNRPGGKGGMDIWYVEVNSMGEAGEPVNMGTPVNTPEDEITPFYDDASKTLYFSSKGHMGVGGHDVFSSYFDLDIRQPEMPENLGSPLNSPRNDIYFMIDEYQKYGMLTSNRDDCNECVSCNCNELYSFEKVPNKYTLAGIIYDRETKLPIANGFVEIKDVNGVFEAFRVKADDMGAYFMELEPELHIFLKARKLGYYTAATVLSNVGMTEGMDFNQDFYIGEIPYSEVAIQGIEYDYNKASLRPASKKVLNEMVNFLEVNNNIRIEISSHTDSRASDEYNMGLSQRRAEMVVHYLISKGISKQRLLATGYGERIPLHTNARSEAQHQKNRRTSFRTLSEDFKGDLKSRKNVN